jgi:hypothetical protein
MGASLILRILQAKTITLFSIPLCFKSFVCHIIASSWCCEVCSSFAQCYGFVQSEWNGHLNFKQGAKGRFFVIWTWVAFV